MAPMEDPVLDQMQALITRWQANADERAVFLTCYRMMTGNVLTALQSGQFNDPAWVDRLMRRFANYYFTALDAYEQEPNSAPDAWRLAFVTAGHTHLNTLQKLLLGVNAHINYDLTLALYDVLSPDWAAFSAEQRDLRLADHCQINAVIAGTIDAVQEQIVEPEMPILSIFDRLLGPVDELITSRIISSWRDTVWRHAMDLLEKDSPEERVEIIQRIEQDALRIGDLIG
jgi:hypothetical protein